MINMNKFFPVKNSISTTNDIWIGLKRNSDGNFYWRRSQKQLHHEGPQMSTAWKLSTLEDSKDCVFTYISPTTLVETFHNDDCTTKWDSTICEVIY